MSPVIRVLVFLCIAVMAARARGAEVIAAAVTSVGLVALAGPEAWRRAWRFLRRLRWLFLSILLVCLFFTPGRPLFPAAGDWFPSGEGLRVALTRLAVLATIAAAAAWLWSGTGRGPLLGALLWLARPLRGLGERAALRLTLTLDLAMEAVTPRIVVKGGWRQAGAVAAALYRAAEERAEQSGLDPVELPGVCRPAAVEWLLPASLFCMALWLETL